MSDRYMILKNDKIIGLEPEFSDVAEVIRRNYRVKKEDSYEVKDFEADEIICVKEMLNEYRIDATPKKEFKFNKPLARKPIARSTKPIARKPIARKPIVFPSNKPFVQPERKPCKKPKPGRNDIIDDAYSAWLGTQACIITGQLAERGAGPYSIHCHHVRSRSRGQRNDYNQVPLIGHLHTYSNHSYHVLGKTGFLEKWKAHIPDGIEDIIGYFETRAKELKSLYDSTLKKGSDPLVP